MRIRTISTGQLRCMGDQEGLILQGCGGDPQEAIISWKCITACRTGRGDCESGIDL